MNDVDNIIESLWHACPAEDKSWHHPFLWCGSAAAKELTYLGQHPTFTRPFVPSIIPSPSYFHLSPHTNAVPVHYPFTIVSNTAMLLWCWVPVNILLLAFPCACRHACVCVCVWLWVGESLLHRVAPP